MLLIQKRTQSAAHIHNSSFFVFARAACASYTSYIQRIRMIWIRQIVMSIRTTCITATTIDVRCSAVYRGDIQPSTHYNHARDARTVSAEFANERAHIHVAPAKLTCALAQSSLVNTTTIHTASHLYDKAMFHRTKSRSVANAVPTYASHRQFISTYGYTSHHPVEHTHWGTVICVFPTLLTVLNHNARNTHILIPNRSVLRASS